MAGALIAIDWENIRRGFGDFVEAITCEQVYNAFGAVASRFGDFRGGTVFGDWTLRPQEARTFEDHGLQAYNVLGSRTGKDRSDSAVMLEVYDWVLNRSEINTVILGSGDSDFKELIRRTRGHGKQIVVCAFGASISGELKTMTPIFPLEAELALTLKTKPVLLLPGFPTTEGLAKWGRFVRRLDGLEHQLPYIVRSYLIHTLLAPSWGRGETEAEKETFVDEAQAAGLLESYEIDNPQRPGKLVNVVRLDQTNETVRQVLGL